MNKNLIVSKVKTATASLFFSAVLSFGNVAKAAESDAPVKETTSAKTFNVKYIEPVEEGYIFNVKYDNLTAREFDLIVKDETGETLYQRSFSNKTFNKKFQISNSLVKAIFIIRPAHADDQRIEVAFQSRTTQDVVISNL